MAISTVEFVNYLGDKVSTSGDGTPIKRAKKQEESFHKGWRVTGVPPGALEKARATHAADATIAFHSGRPPPKGILRCRLVAIRAT